MAHRGRGSSGRPELSVCIYVSHTYIVIHIHIAHITPVHERLAGWLASWLATLQSRWLASEGRATRRGGARGAGVCGSTAHSREIKFVVVFATVTCMMYVSGPRPRLAC